MFFSWLTITSADEKYICNKTKPNRFFQIGKSNETRPKNIAETEIY